MATTKMFQVVGGFPSTLPTVTESDNGKVAQVVEGQWQATTIDDLKKQILNNFIVIGSEEPTTQCLWFDTRKALDEAVLLFTTEDASTYEIQAESDGIMYGVVNASTDGEPTETKYNFTII